MYQEVSQNMSLFIYEIHYHRPLLHETIHNNNLRICELLLRNGADVNIKDSSNNTALYLAVSSMRIDCISLLIQYKADIHSKGVDNLSPYEIAIKNNNLEIMNIINKNN